MYFFIPFSIFLASLFISAWLIARKFVYLKKLAPEVLDNTGVSEGNFWEEFFPELAVRVKKINLKEYRIKFLANFEIFLRKFRLVSLRVDTLIGRLIHRVRKTTTEHAENLNQVIAEEKEISRKSTGKNGKKKNLKEEEQRLIIEIARNPKEAKLYGELGNVYVKMGEDGDALESFKKAAELDPQNEEFKAGLDEATLEIEGKK